MTAVLQPQKSFLRLLDTAVEIQIDPEPTEQDKAFLTRQLVQVTLPHSSPGNVPIWKRKNGNLTLAIRSGWNYEKDQPIGYPFGSIGSVSIKERKVPQECISGWWYF